MGEVMDQRSENDLPEREKIDMKSEICENLSMLQSANLFYRKNSE